MDKAALKLIKEDLESKKTLYSAYSDAALVIDSLSTAVRQAELLNRDIADLKKEKSAALLELDELADLKSKKKADAELSASKIVDDANSAAKAILENAKMQAQKYADKAEEMKQKAESSTAEADRARQEVDRLRGEKSILESAITAIRGRFE